MEYFIWYIIPVVERFAFFFYIRERNVQKTPVLEYLIFKTHSTSGIIHYFSYIRARNNLYVYSIYGTFFLFQFWTIWS